MSSPLTLILSSRNKISIFSSIPTILPQKPSSSLSSPIFNLSVNYKYRHSTTTTASRALNAFVNNNKNNSNNNNFNNCDYSLLNKYRIVENKILSSLNQNFKRMSSSSTMAKVPKSISMDPDHIPLSGCDVKKVVHKVSSDTSNLHKVDADSFIFLTYGEKLEGDEKSQKSSNNGGTSMKPIVEEHLKNFDANLGTSGNPIQQLITTAEFKASAGSTESIRMVRGSSGLQSYSLVGIGSQSELKNSGCSKIGASIASVLKQNKCKKAVLVFPSIASMEPRFIQCILESMYLDLSVDNRFKSVEDKKARTAPLEEISIFTPSADKIDEYLNRAKVLAEATHFSRDLVNAPPNYCNTCTLANAAMEMAKEVGLEGKVLELEEIEKLKMGSYLAVAKGSMYPPKFIHLTYKPKDGKPVNKKLAFIGKGLCFDAGGYNLKVGGGSSIELMKFDMGGSAAVFGAAKAIGNLKPSGVEVHFIVAAAENMVSSMAYRPGDIITASNNKTIEVGNTDAEGRLTLADALVYAEKLEVDAIVDLATLTGACVVALGTKYAGLWSSDDDLANKILSSADASGEYMWKMPLAHEYRELLDSKIADMNNIGGGGKAGSITAALFLKEFVETTPWAHIDIAGPAWNYKDGKATGYGVRTIVDLALSYSSK